MDWLILLTIPLIVIGFFLRINPFLVVTSAGIYTGLVAGLDLYQVISDIGKSFVDNRYIGIVWLMLPLLAILEKNGIKEQAKNIISNVKAATTGRILIIYFAFRQITAALGLLSLGGHAQMVRPLIAPMAEAAAKLKYKNLSHEDSQRIKAHSSATDNVAVFFGEDVFIAVHSILLIKAFYEGYDILVEPLQLSVWAIPTAILACIIHCTRLYFLDKKLDNIYAKEVTK